MSPLSQEPSRYVVGIDLGTTNSAMAFSDTEEAAGRIDDFRILQIAAPGEAERRDTLPSFHYEASSGEFAEGAFDLPWSAEPERGAVGAFARAQGALAPGRLIASAKSWLCHGGVDRRARILPWHGAPYVRRLSPVEATARFLAHMRRAWNHDHPAHPLEAQEVVVTIPASFDEVARELTVEALSLAGLERVTLLEEPQAAFYAWLARHGAQADGGIGPGQAVLVCDIGGGTTDFTIVETTDAGEGGVAFRRMAVGDHLILGGDNLDLALAHRLESRLDGGRQLDARSWGVLVRLCCQAKERLLGPSAPDSLTLNLPATGSRLIGGGRQVEIGRDEALAALVDGFLPFVPPDAPPARAGSGFREFGLPYAADPAVTRYLAEFLARHAQRAPDAILLNGGFFESSALRARLLDVLRSWYGEGWSPLVLRNDRLDMAVARGAAYYGLVRRGRGVRIAAGLPRALYAGVADRAGATRAVCVAPSGLEEGREIEVPGRPFELLLRCPVEFPLYVSTTRTTDAPGESVEIDPAHLSALPPMRTVLKTSRKASRSTVGVKLVCRLTEIGTLDLACREIDGDRQWRLQFDLRAQSEAAPSEAVGVAETVEESWIDACAAPIREVFGPKGAPPTALARRIEEAAGRPRAEWPPILLRRVWEALMDQREARRADPDREARWLNLAGFCLRPGFGVALDDWRIDESWGLFPQGLAHPKNELCRAEWWILWRRIAGGLNEGRQAALADPLMSRLRAEKGAFRCGPHEAAEMWRLLACLERLASETRIALGRMLADRVSRKGWNADSGAAAWALARLAARAPLYGPLNACLDPETVAGWIDALLSLESPREKNLFEVALMARRTGDRYRDLDEDARERIATWLQLNRASAHLVSLVLEGGELDAAEQSAAAGDTLPLGLRWADV